jgi:hypothetical protein
MAEILTCDTNHDTCQMSNVNICPYQIKSTLCISCTYTVDHDRDVGAINVASTRCLPLLVIAKQKC